MPMCSYCSARAGKRPCPVLGAICPQCCGAHRGRDIACPADCAFLRPAASDVEASANVLGQLYHFGGARGGDWLQRARDAFLRDAREPDATQLGGLLLWVQIGFEIVPGERPIDRFANEHGGSLAAQEQRALAGLRQATPHLLTVDEVRASVGFHATDRLAGTRVFVHEQRGSHALTAGVGLLAWLLRGEHHVELGPAVCPVPAAHVDAVARALADEAERQRAVDAAASPQVCIRRGLPVAYRTLSLAVRADTQRAEPAAGSPRAIYMVRDPAGVRARLERARSVTRVADGLWHWLPNAAAAGLQDADANVARITIALSGVRLTLTASSLEHLAAGKKAARALLGDTAHHRLDLGVDAADAHAADPAVAPPRSDAALSVNDDIHAFHRVLDDAMIRREKEQAAPAAVARSAALARQRRHRLPPLAHESMAHLVPGLRQAIAGCVARLRSLAPDPPLPLIDAVVEQPELAAFLRTHLDSQAAQTWTDEQFASEVAQLTHHIHYALCYELRRKKTFWVDEALAWMLSATELDIRGACLELPFEAFALAFTDTGTLALAQQCLLHTSECRLSGMPLEILTVYVVRPPEVRTDDARALSVHFLFEAGDGGWPYLLTRELNVRADADLAEILDSRGPDVDLTRHDPVFVSPELEKLLHIVLNAILYATSAHLEPILLRPETTFAKPARRARQQRRQRERAHCSLETACWLAGKIDIARVRQLRDLDATEHGRQLNARFLVRGHWRRAHERWVDQRLRWIEPYWKGPDLATVLERDYRLRP